MTTPELKTLTVEVHDSLYESRDVDICEFFNCTNRILKPEKCKACSLETVEKFNEFIKVQQ